MKVRITSRFAGKVNVAIVSDKVHETRIADLKTGDNEIDIPVSADWGAGAYVVAFAHRPLDQAARRMPGRALGLAWFGVDRDQRKLQVSIGGPEKMRAAQALSIPVRVAGLAAGEEAFVTRRGGRCRHSHPDALRSARSRRRTSSGSGSCRRKSAISTAS